MSAGIAMRDANSSLPPKLWLVAVSEALASASWRLLDFDDRLHSERYLRVVDRHTFVVTRAALRYALFLWTGTDPSSFRFRRSRWGKPSLCSPICHSRLSFSISHSGTLSLIGICEEGRRMGVDLEQNRKFPEAQAIAKACFGNSAAALLADLPPEARDLAFLQFWTAAEAFAKATGYGWEGHGGSIPLYAKKPNLGGLSFIGEEQWSLAPIDVGSDYVGTLVMESVVAVSSPLGSLKPE